MKLLLFCLLLAVTPGWGEDRQAAVPVVLYTKFQVEPPTPVLESLQDELKTIMSPVGMQFEWRSLTKVQGSEVAVELAVITFKGKCDLNGMVARSSTPGALGWTHVSDGVILPFSDVDCDRIRQFVQRDILQEAEGQRDEIFGRAIARVLAHELYHVFANTEKHGSCGVGKSAYSVRELLSDNFQFEERNSMALKRSKTIEHLESAARSALEAPAPL
jgi:hypothetical protein